ncbi:hypothetical protein DB346_15235 [Verrucomicrobia bacterium LW23]|nr:hypothetical protein DB346_15235 [Verrucomicrobia bacterium LW23]
MCDLLSSNPLFFAAIARAAATAAMVALDGGKTWAQVMAPPTLAAGQKVGVLDPGIRSEGGTPTCRIPLTTRGVFPLRATWRICIL